MNKNFVAIILFLVDCIIANAQEKSWSLTKCMEVALQNNIDLKISQLEIKKIQKSQNSVLNRLLPSVDFTVEQSYNFGSTIDPSTNARVSSNIQNDNFFLNARTNLIDFSAFANAQKDKINIQLAKVDKEIIENEYKLQILERFYDALYNQELLKIQKEQLAQAAVNLDRIRKEVSLGSRAKSDLYDMQLGFSEEENRYLTTEQSYNMKKKQLFQLMNVNNIETNEVVLEPYWSKNISKENESELYNPKIKQAALFYQNSLKTIRLERANNLPVLSAFYGFNTFYFKTLNQLNQITDPFENQWNDNKSQRAGLQMNIPIFNGFRKNKIVNASKLESEKAKLTLDKVKQQIAQQIALEQQNKVNFLQLEAKLIEKQRYAEESFATTQAKFTNGKVEAVLFASVKNQYLLAKYDFLKNRLQLEYTDLKINLLKNDSL
jgi:outer membrane protein